MIAIQILNCLAYGALLLIIALGLVLVDGLRRVINFAHIKLPEFLLFRDSVQPTPSGKKQKFKLREELKGLKGASSNV